jgi:alpha-tubulin suppressor-like RCC1 family protein
MWGAPPFSDRGIMDMPPSLTNIVSVSCGAEHTLALRSDGTMIAWGFNLRGQTSPPPSAVDLISISAGADHSLALRRDGLVIGWGNNQYGAATPPQGLSDVKAIAGGWNYSLALINDGTVVGWGSSQYGAATIPPSLTNAVAIAAGDFCGAAIRADGSVLYWGRDAYFTPTPSDGITLDGFTNIVDIGVGHCYAIGRRADGTLVQYPKEIDPKRVAPPSLPNITKLAVSVSHDLALLGDPPPRLAIQHDGANVVLSWPMTPTQFILEQATTPQGPFGSVAAAVSSGAAAQQFQVVQPANEPTAFFRLRGQ